MLESYEDWSGILSISKDETTGKSQVTRSFAKNPLKLIHSQLSSSSQNDSQRKNLIHICRVYVISYGGGLVSGDEIKLKVRPFLGPVAVQLNRL